VTAAPEIAAPDLIEAVVAFRAWRVVDGALLSPFIPCRWEGPVMHAECYPANRALLFGRGWLTEPHDPPDQRPVFHGFLPGPCRDALG